MSTIKYVDTDGNKSALLPKGTFGYDDFQLGGDKGRVYIGTGEENLPLAKKSELEEHESDTTNPHAVTKDQVGLGNVDDTADIDKPVSTATQAALDLKADQATTYTKDEVDAIAAAQNEASELGYDNTVSGLTATTVQEAVNELNVEKQDVLAEGAFVDGDKTKLDGTEITSQLDVRDTANRDTDNHTDGTTNGVYTLAERAKLAAIDQEVATTSDVTFNTVNGRDINVDGTKLDLIEDGATADQTGAEIKALYEAEADTNAYTDAEKTLVDVSTGLDTTATTLPAAVNELHGQITALENRELTHKIDGVVAPTVTDDADAGYEVGSLWIDTVADEAYRCADATAGAAVWVNTTLDSVEVAALIESAQADLKAITGTTVDTRYDKLLAIRDVISMDYTSGNLDYVRYEGDDDATVYYRDVMTYNVDGNLVEVKHYWNTADLVTASGQTVLTYSAGDLATATYSE
jgi:hypothetical protein